MALVCRQCSRVNPEDAYYCYHDGAALAGRASSDGPINLGAQPFPSPFVFPSGVNCRNFDQLAMACQQNWKEASAVLTDGFFGSFFGAIGRLDLARVAKEAADFPDANRGLDQLLAKLPSQSLEAPKLRVEPTEINLGQLVLGVDHKFDLALQNQGMRLVFGNVASEVPWLTLGGHASKIFELTDEMTIPVTIRGASLRARLKPQEGRLIVGSNAGNFIITITIEVPPIPFAEGVLAGALSPRQIAEKAKAAPRDAVPLFESGAVAKWFAANGLAYPVQGPTAPGTAGVQQFFEALGLAKPPKVDFTAEPIAVEGAPGQTIEVPLTVSTRDKKLVYAYATGDQPWIDGNTVKPNKQTCTIQLKVTVPPNPGETLAAKVTIHANGNQRFTVPLTVAVHGVKGLVPDFAFEPAEPTFAPAVSAAEPAEEPAFFTNAPMPAASTSTSIKPIRSAPTLPAASAPMLEGDGDVAFAAPKPLDRALPPCNRAWIHAMPAALLVVALLGIMVRDYYSANAADNIDRRDRIALSIDWSAKPEKGIGNSLMFGLQDLSERNVTKQLVFSSLGQSNSVVLSIDGNNRVFGKALDGRPDGPLVAYSDRSKVATWLFIEDGISVTQRLQLIPGDPIENPSGGFQRSYDTCLVRYKITNRDKKPHDVGFRFLLDTLIGGNDRPLFTLPGRTGIVQTIVDLRGKQIPDYIQALERPDLKSPGTIAQLNLRLGGKLEFPSRVSLTEWPGHAGKEKFEVPTSADASNQNGNAPQRDSGDLIKDSAIAIYWKAEPLGPGKSRELGFTYGIGNVGGLADLTILNPGPIVQGGDFSLVALVADANKISEATIILPEGLTLAAGSKSTVKVDPTKDDAGKAQPSLATWTIRAPHAGPYTIGVTAGGITTQRVVTVRKTNIF